MSTGFHTTRWSLVRAATDGPSDAAREAADQLYRQYWPALYSYLRRAGHAAVDAEDLVQGFVTELLHKRSLRPDPGLGSFRGYLLGALRHYLGHQRDHDRADKRGAGRPLLSLDREGAEAQLLGSEDESPGRAFDRAWARAVLERSRERLAGEFAARGAQAQFEALAPLLGSVPPAGEYGRLAAELGRSEVSLKVAVHRMRRRFGELIRDEVAQTTGDALEVDRELQELLQAVGPELPPTSEASAREKGGELR